VCRTGTEGSIYTRSRLWRNQQRRGARCAQFLPKKKREPKGTYPKIGGGKINHTIRSHICGGGGGGNEFPDVRGDGASQEKERRGNIICGSFLICMRHTIGKMGEFVLGRLRSDMRGDQEIREGRESRREMRETVHSKRNLGKRPRMREA